MHLPVGRQRARVGDEVLGVPLELLALDQRQLCEIVRVPEVSRPQPQAAHRLAVVRDGFVGVAHGLPHALRPGSRDRLRGPEREAGLAGEVPGDEGGPAQAARDAQANASMARRSRPAIQRSNQAES